MRKKIFVRSPCLSQSGYGEQSRFALRALRSREDLFDIYIQPIPWGKSGWVWQESEFRDWMDERIAVTQQMLSSRQLRPDMSLQITIPNEFQKLAPINVGYTAGIETDRVSPKWIEKGNEMDKILVVSNHSKQTYLRTKAKLQNGQDYKLETPIEVVWENTVLAESEEIECFKPEHDFNFLVVSQMGPRKNFKDTVIWFVENFRDKEVGLILKTHDKGSSIMDYEVVKRALDSILEAFPERKCSVSLLHGDLSEGQMRGLYEHDKVKCIINLAHGEGFGLPLFEAARVGLPIITMPWSGPMDFLHHDGEDYFNKVAYTIRPVQDFAVWDGVIQKDSMWAFPEEKSYKAALNFVHENYDDIKEGAVELQEKVNAKFSNEVLYEKFCNAILGKSNQKPVEIEGISFCIPTNGAKPEKTKLTINSIKREMGDFPYEIVIAGDVENFKDIEGVILVDKKEEAHSRKVATLRNAGGDNSKYDTIVWLDDDVIVGEGWLKNTLEHSKHNGWDVLGNKLLNPDGTRHWDRATLNPHIMVSYDHPQYDKNLYQTSGFIIVRREIFSSVRWDEECLVRGDQEDKMSEDVKFSIDLVKAGYELGFNGDSTVWHNDESYTEFFNGQVSVTLKKKILEDRFGIETFQPNDQTFVILKEQLYV